MITLHELTDETLYKNALYETITRKLWSVPDYLSPIIRWSVPYLRDLLLLIARKANDDHTLNNRNPWSVPYSRR